MDGNQEQNRRARLRYVRETYFPELSDAYLARRCTGECTSSENGTISAAPILRLDRTFGGVQRTIINHLAVSGPPIPSGFIDVICDLFVREHLFSNEGRTAELVDSAARNLARYVRYGDGSPYGILNGEFIRATELGFEHRVPLAPRTDIDLRRRVVEFLRGRPGSDWDVIRQATVERPIEQEVLDTVQGGASLVILTGAAGDGKSTLLRRVGLALRRENWRVFIANAVDAGPFPQLPRFDVGAGVRTCLLIDNADIATGFPGLERALEVAPDVHVVLCARSYRWEKKKFRFDRAVNLQVPAVGTPEIEALSEQIVKWQAFDEPRSLEKIRSAITTSVRSRHPHLLAAMMSATHGKNFRAIVDGIISDFTDAGEAWVLAYVACGALISDLSEGFVGRLPRRVFHKLIVNEGREVRTVLQEVEGEIVSMSVSGQREPIEYDLRHPDIVAMVLDRLFKFTPDRRIGDLDTFCECIAKISIASREAWEEIGFNKGRIYTDCIVSAISQSVCGESDSIDTDDAVHIVRSVERAFGGYEKEINLRVKYNFELVNAFIRKQGKAGGSLRSAIEELFLYIVQLDSDSDRVWQKWMRFAATHSMDASDTADAFSARRVGRLAWERGAREGGFLATWIQLEAEAVNIGDAANPAPYSARWLGREAWKEGVTDEEFITAWVQLEERVGNVGDGKNPQPYSARWLCRGSWAAGVRKESFLTAWFRLEERAANVGDLEEPSSNSARWVGREVWKEGLRLQNFLVCWIQLESRVGNIGEADDPAPYSARWLGRQARDIDPEGRNFLFAWILAEERAGNLGDLDDPQPYTARWLGRSVSSDPMDESLLVLLFQLEERAGNRGDFNKPDPHSARWLARSAWDAGFRGESFVGAWIHFEERAGKIGGEQDPEPYSARWVGRQMWAADRRGESFLTAWLSLEKRAHNVGQSDDPHPYSARWLGRSAWELGSRGSSVVEALMLLEISAGNLGSSSPEDRYSARWLGWAAWDEDLRDELTLQALADAEWLGGNVGNFHAPGRSARGILRWIASAMEGGAKTNALGKLIRLETTPPYGVPGDVNEPEAWSARWCARKAWPLPRCGSYLFGLIAQYEFANGNRSGPYSSSWYYHMAKQRYGLQSASFEEWVAEENGKIAHKLPGVSLAASVDRG